MPCSVPSTSAPPRRSPAQSDRRTGDTRKRERRGEPNRHGRPHAEETVDRQVDRIEPQDDRRERRRSDSRMRRCPITRPGEEDDDEGRREQCHRHDLPRDLGREEPAAKEPERNEVEIRDPCSVKKLEIHADTLAGRDASQGVVQLERPVDRRAVEMNGASRSQPTSGRHRAGRSKHSKSPVCAFAPSPRGGSG